MSRQKRAHLAVYDAVTAGRLPHISTRVCVGCGGPARMYHHPRGYEPAHWLDVEPVCSRCHDEREHGHDPSDVVSRVTIEVYDDEIDLTRRLKVAALTEGATLRELTLEAWRLWLAQRERDGADLPPAS